MTSMMSVKRFLVCALALWAWALQAQISYAPAAAGGGAVDWSASHATTPNAMGALAISTAHTLNSKSITADSTLTFSATPSTGTWFSLLLTETGGAARTVTIPSSFSVARGATITSFTLPANAKVLLSWYYDGSAYILFGDPVSILNLTVATVAPGADYIEFYDATDGTCKRTLIADLFPHSTLTYGATTDLDFLGDSFRTVTLTGNITFTTSNRVAGRSITVRIIGDGSLRTLTFPAWKFVGAAAPANLAANKIALLTITAFGTADTDVVAAFSAEP